MKKACTLRGGRCFHIKKRFGVSVTGCPLFSKAPYSLYIPVNCRTKPCMMKTTLKKEPKSKARLEARISTQVHSTLKRAAEIQGRTVTDFVVEAALSAATKTIEESHIVRLSLEGQRAFAEALLNPPEPNEALKKAFERHEKLFGKKG